MPSELEEMINENLTASAETASNTTDTAVNYAAKTAAFFDPGWQLVATIEFYFRYVVIAVGVFGTAANALVLYALIAHHARQTKKRGVNLLLINQNVLDLLACVLLVISCSMIVSNIYLTGALGYVLCIIFVSGNSTTCMQSASIINLMPPLLFINNLTQ